MSAPLLHQRFPAARLPRTPLGRWPSPIRALTDELYCLDEGTCSPVYGGNKVRKLEYILGSAPGTTDVITVGAAGSHHVLATALHAARLGIRTHALLVPQPDTAHVRANLRRSQARCASLTQTTPARLLPAIRALSRQLTQAAGQVPLFVPIGGSSAAGVLGWISGGLEIAAAVADGHIPKPQRVYVTLGSGGTAAGLLVGLRLAGLHTRVVAVRVVDRPLGYAWQVRALGQSALHHLRTAGASIPRVRLRGLVVEERWREGGYGVVTPRIESALAAAEALDLPVEPTYTARCLGAALDWQAAEPGPAVYIQTKNAVPLPEGPPLDDALTGLLQ